MAYINAYANAPGGDTMPSNPDMPEDPVRRLLSHHKELSGIFEQERQQFLREADEACQRLEMRIEEVRAMRQMIRGMA